MPISGEFTTPPLTDTQSFSLTCSNQADNAVAVLSIRVADLLVAWNAPTQNIDGSQLTDLAGFRVYWGTEAGNFESSRRLDEDVREWRMDDFPSGTYHVAVTAIRESGSESALSEVVTKIVP